MRPILAVCFLLLAPGVCSASPATEVKQLLDGQVAAWNKKDLETYMGGYWKSDELTFYSGGTVTRGWQPTLARYRERYTGAGKEMGTLSFTELDVRELAPGYALARGHWHLAMTAGKPLDGLFTVVVRKLPEGWRIIHDHSSM